MFTVNRTFEQIRRDAIKLAKESDFVVKASDKLQDKDGNVYKVTMPTIPQGNDSESFFRALPRVADECTATNKGGETRTNTYKGTGAHLAKILIGSPTEEDAGSGSDSGAGHNRLTELSANGQH